MSDPKTKAKDAGAESPKYGARPSTPNVISECSLSGWESACSCSSSSSFALCRSIRHGPSS